MSGKFSKPFPPTFNFQHKSRINLLAIGDTNQRTHLRCLAGDVVIADDDLEFLQHPNANSICSNATCKCNIQRQVQMQLVNAK